MIISNPSRPSIAKTSDNEDRNAAPPPPYNASTREHSAPDIVQWIERGLAQHNASQNVLRRWLFEALSVINIAVCMGKNNHFHTSRQDFTHILEERSL
jgi:hypothetical protein